MDSMRVIDVWQVVLQEPRVAAKEAEILLQGELGQMMVRDALVKQQAAIKRTVQGTQSLGGRRVTRKEDDSSEGKLVYRPLRKGMKKQSSVGPEKPSIVTPTHVDTFA